MPQRSDVTIVPFNFFVAMPRLLFSKQVVSCKPAKLDIPAHGKAEMKVEYVPRKINSKYRKTISIVNCLNPHGNLDVEISASNTDTHHVLYHSHFYKVGIERARAVAGACLIYFCTRYLLSVSPGWPSLSCASAMLALS